MQRTQMVNAFLDAGIALIAPDGMERPDRNGSRGWFFLPDAQRPRLRDEATFTREVLDDAVVRHGIDRARVAISGYSIGGSLAWYLACAQADLAQVYLPVAGAFWRPHPQAEDCDGPIRLLHTHGWRDGTVPLEGRPLRGGTLYQGDVFEALQTLRALNGCAGLRADEYNTKGTFWRRAWTECDEGTALELALHTGGHLVPDDWAPMAIAWWQNVMDGSGADALQ